MSPREWPARFDLRGWGVFVARHFGVIVGGVAVAPAVDVLPDVATHGAAAALWDLRVHPNHRGRQVGTALFHAATRWARTQEYRTLLVETQDVNVAACCYYQKLGCRLLRAEPDAYPEAPGEARLVWELPLDDVDRDKPGLPSSAWAKRRNCTGH
jgi:GNAT superfamily N-acetyltransferase